MDEPPFPVVKLHDPREKGGVAGFDGKGNVCDFPFRQLPSKGKGSRLGRCADIGGAGGHAFSLLNIGFQTEGHCPSPFSQIRKGMAHRHFRLGRQLLPCPVKAGKGIGKAVHRAGDHKGRAILIALDKLPAGARRTDYICHTFPLEIKTKRRTRNTSVT